MKDSFWWNSTINDLLFRNLNITSIYGLLLVCFCVILMAFLFEFLRYLQAKQRQYEILLRSKQIRLICRNDSSTLLTTTSTTKSGESSNINSLNLTFQNRLLFLLYKFLVWLIMTIDGYIIMLLVMMFNGWLFISAIIGGGIGYFIFGQLFMKINLQNCQIIRETFCKKTCDSDFVPSVGDGESTPVLQTTSSLPSSSSSTTNRRQQHSCHVEVSVNVHAENS